MKFLVATSHGNKRMKMGENYALSYAHTQTHTHTQTQRKDSKNR